MLKSTSCQVVGVELGGFDTHSNQGGAEPNGTQAKHLRAVAEALSAIYWDWNETETGPLLQIAMTEFGRTNGVNDSGGTDHGESSLMIAVGTGVNGGVYNMGENEWPDGTMAGPYIPHTTDYRAVLAEAFERHFNIAPGDLDPIIPGWDDLSGSQFDYLNYLS